MAWTACIVRIHKKGKVENFLVDTDKFTVGRSPDCDFVIADSQISRQHLGIIIKNSQLFLKDLGSSNGSFQGNEQVPEDRVVPYKGGEIRFGNTQIQISFELVAKKIESKSLSEASIPKEESDKILAILDAAKEQSKNLHQDYQNLIAQSRAQMAAELATANDEAKKKAIQIITESEVGAKKIIEAARVAEQEIAAAAKKEELHIVSSAQKKAEIEVAKVYSDANHKQQVAQEEAQKIIADASVKAHAIKDDAQKVALEAVQEGQRRVQDLLTEAQNKTQAANDQVQKVLQDAQKKSLDHLQEAQKASQDQIQDAQRQAQEILSDAARKAADLDLGAQKKFQEMHQDAQSLAQDLVYEAKTAAEDITKKAENFYAIKKREAEQSAQKILQDVQQQVDKLYAGFETKKRDELNRLEKDSTQYKIRVDQEFKANSERLGADFQLKVKMFDEECAIRRRQLEKDLQSENELIAEAKAQRTSLEAEIDKYQVELRQTLEGLHAGQAKFSEFQHQFDEAQKKYDEYVFKSAALAKEESRHQAELTELVRKKDEELNQIQSLKRKFDEERSRVDKEAYDQRLKIQVELNDIRQRESADIQRMRLDELEKIDVLRKKTLEEIIKNKDIFTLKLAEKVEARTISLMKDRSAEFDLDIFHSEVLEMVLSAIEEQSYELTSGHEADIKHLVHQETSKRKSTLKRFSIVAGAAFVILISLFIYRGGNVEDILLGKNDKGETGAEEFGRRQREQREAKKFDPPQTDFIKSSYTDNVLYTRNYYKVYADQQLQEKWIHDLNRLFSKEFQLEDDTIVKFVAIESTLVNSLQREREQIVPDFSELGIEKMRKLEKSSLEEMKSLLKDQYRMRKFQSFSENFWFDQLKERKPAAE